MSNRNWIVAPWEGGLPLITFLAHFRSWEQGDGYNSIKVQFNETHPYHSKKGVIK